MKHTSTQLKDLINLFLNRVNLKLDTLTYERIENNRLNKLEQRGNFTKEVFAVPSSFLASKHEVILKALSSHSSRFQSFQDQSDNDVGYSYDNNYFSSPDAEVLYTVVREFSPNTVIEVGCGNSTKITKQAILDGKVVTKLISIDPEPRADIKHLPDQVLLQPVEEVDPSLFESLQSGDILFIDSSHIIKTGNDVVFLFTNIIPRLPSGVVIHIHDIFIPYDYPKDWVIGTDWNFNEQYLVHCVLMLSDKFEVIWPGYYLQKTISDFADYFPNIRQGNAQSLWLRKL